MSAENIDKRPSGNGETPASPCRLEAANDNGGPPATTIDPRVVVIARAIGRQIAREAIAALPAANDNRPGEAMEEPQ